MKCYVRIFAVKRLLIIESCNTILYAKDSIFTVYVDIKVAAAR